MFLFFSSRIRHTRCALVTGVQTCALPIDFEIRKIESKPATRVVFAPAQQNLRLQGSSQALKRVFVGRPLCQGDVVATAGQQRVDNIPPNVAQYLRAPAYALPEIPLSVVQTAPKGAVPTHQHTQNQMRSTRKH